MPQCRETVRIANPQGLHARPASPFVQLANQFRARIVVRKADEAVDGKSIMGVLTLALEPGSVVEVIADGPDAQPALEALVQFLLKKDEEPAGPAAPGGPG